MDIQTLNAPEERGALAEIARMTVPAFFELLLASTVSLVSMAMLGHISAADLAAAGLSNQPFAILIGVFAAVNVGTTTAVAWNMGGHKIREARAITGQSISLNLALGLATTLIGILTARPLIVFMGAGAELNERVLESAILYFRVICTGLSFQAVSMAITAALRGAGETKMPMIYNVLGNIVNALLCYALIFGNWGAPRLGILGAAIAATVSRASSFAVSLYSVFRSKKMPLTIGFSHVKKLDASRLKKILKIGAPSAAEQIVMQSGYTFFSRSVVFLGTAAFAAHQVGNNINAVAIAPAQAFAVAATTLVGQSMGARGDAAAAKRLAGLIHKLALIVAGVGGVFFILSARVLPGVFTSDGDVARQAVSVMLILGFLQIPMATQNVASGALRGAGDTYYPLYASIIGVWFIRLVLAFVFLRIFSWGLWGAWIAVLIDQSARALFVHLRFRGGKWAKRAY